MKFKTAATALLLLAVATIVPACELSRDCDPQVEMCEYQTHPHGTLAPRG